MNTKIISDQVIHEPENHQFVLTVNNESVVSRYRFIGENTMEFYSTYTPLPIRGQGYAAIVVNTALDYARKNNYEIRATCWYAKKILDQQ